MGTGFQTDLSRRERQIMDVLYSSGPSSAAEVREQLPDPPSYSAVRAMLRILEDKGHIAHSQDGPRYVYSPSVTPERARQGALRHVLDTFFGGSREAVMAALLEESGDNISEAEFERMQRIVELARGESDR